MVELEYHDNAKNAHKFWRVEVQYQSGQTQKCWLVVAEWGRVGSGGQTRAWQFATEKEAQIAARLKARQKRRKGYLDVQAPVPAAKSTEDQGAPVVTVELDAHEKPRVVVTILSYEPGYRIWVNGGYADAHETAGGIAELLRYIVEGYEADEGYRVWKYNVENLDDFAALARWLSSCKKPRVKCYSRDEMLSIDVASEFALD
jgi:predicted DNA-binding WGR domain protein